LSYRRFLLLERLLLDLLFSESFEFDFLGADTLLRDVLFDFDPEEDDL
jgi:hypothetical protein